MSGAPRHGVLGRLVTCLAVAAATVVLSATPAPAVDVGFLFLIENGQAQFAQSLGTANVVVWNRTIPDSNWRRFMLG